MIAAETGGSFLAYWRIWDGKIVAVIREDDSHGPITKGISGFYIAGIGKKTGWVGRFGQNSYELIRLLVIGGSLVDRCI